MSDGAVARWNRLYVVKVSSEHQQGRVNDILNEIASEDYGQGKSFGFVTGDNAKGRTSSSDSPPELRVLLFVDNDNTTIGQNHLGFHKIVDTQTTKS